MYGDHPFELSSLYDFYFLKAFKTHYARTMYYTLNGIGSLPCRIRNESSSKFFEGELSFMPMSRQLLYLFRCQAQFEKATMDKLKCQQEADETAKVISLANRLVGGLASENVRWAECIEQYRKDEKLLPGDVLLITAFVSYVGSFTKRYRSFCVFKSVCL